MLVAANAVSKQDYDNAVAAQGQAAADVATGKAAVAMAQINLGYTNVVSPITGRSGLSLVTQGAYVQASAATLMATVQQIDPIYVDLTQSSVEGLQLRRDVASGQLKLNGSRSGESHACSWKTARNIRRAGSLQFTDITVDQGTGSVTVRAIFPNPRFVLLPGMFVRARIDEGVNDDAMLVPQVGVTHDPTGQATALVVGPDNKVAVRTLQLRGTSGDQWIVEGGLERRRSRHRRRRAEGATRRAGAGGRVADGIAAATPSAPVTARPPYRAKPRGRLRARLRRRRNRRGAASWPGSSSTARSSRSSSRS